MPTPESTFITQVEAHLGKMVGNIVSRSLVNNQLTKLRKHREALSPDDCKIVVQNVITSVALFVTNHEAEIAKTELNHLLNSYFVC